MSIHREGFKVILLATLLLAGINVLVFFTLGEGIVLSILLGMSVVFYFLIDVILQ